MLDRAKSTDASPQADRNADTRPVEFRGGGFAPRLGRSAGWIALALVIGFWQLAGSIGWVNPLFLPTPSRSRGRSISSRSAARFGIICPIP